MKSPITTHVLDTTRGKPASGLVIQLRQQQSDGGYTQIAAGTTDDDGRITDLLKPGELTPGVYQMRFETETYLTSLGTPGFYPEAVITFRVVDVTEHYHIPLLLSPFGYSTYRGS